MYYRKLISFQTGGELEKRYIYMIELDIFLMIVT